MEYSVQVQNEALQVQASVKTMLRNITVIFQRLHGDFISQPCGVYNPGLPPLTKP